MEPDRQDRQKALQPSAGQKPNRFRIVKLEERIAPSKGGGQKTAATVCTCGAATCLCGTCGHGGGYNTFW